MTWQRRLIEQVPRAEIPAFLTDLQALVAALREGRVWHDLLTDRLRSRATLVMEYLQPGPARDAVAAALQAYSATGDVGGPDAPGHRAHGE